jgi:peptide methionine sulfoxide reductase MsrA
MRKAVTIAFLEGFVKEIVVLSFHTAVSSERTLHDETVKVSGDPRSIESRFALKIFGLITLPFPSF